MWSQINGIFSSNISDPFAGGFASKRAVGFSCSCLFATIYAGSTELNIDKASATIEITG